MCILTIINQPVTELFSVQSHLFGGQLGQLPISSHGGEMHLVIKCLLWLADLAVVQAPFPIPSCSRCPSHHTYRSNTNLGVTTAEAVDEEETILMNVNGREGGGRQPHSFWTAGCKTIVSKWRSSEYSEGQFKFIQ